MSTPEEALAGTALYLKICFLGIPFITAYNIISSIFRGMGDSKSPMYFIAIACVVNIALDYVFMGVLLRTFRSSAGNYLIPDCQCDRGPDHVYEGKNRDYSKEKRF